MSWKQFSLATRHKADRKWRRTGSALLSRISVYGDARVRDLERRGGAKGRNSV